jgi:hypothetical protein
MRKITKIFLNLFFVFILVTSYTTTANAESAKQKDLRLISELKENIENLGETPIKKKPFKHNLRKDYIAALKEQLKKIEKEKGIKDKKQVLLDDLCKQIKELDPDAKTVCDESTDALDKDKDVIALKKIIKEKEEEKTVKEKAAKEKAAKEAEEKVAKQEEEEKREISIIKVKKEIYFLGGTPISEFEIETEDAYLQALRKQIEELKIQKEAEEKEIAESIPEWFLIPPQGSDVLMYVRGTAVSDQLQLALDLATNAALRSLGKKVETRLASKSKETIRQAGMGEDQPSKTEINLISSTVVDEVTVSGFEAIETKLVSLDNGSYRAFILLEYPVAKAYKTYMEKIEKSPELKGRLTEIKNTDIYKELQKAVSNFSDS